MRSLEDEEELQALLKRAGLDLRTLLEIDNDILLNAALREAGVVLVGDRMRAIARVKQLRQERRRSEDQGKMEGQDRSLRWTESSNVDSRRPTPKTARRASGSGDNKIHPYRPVEAHKSLHLDAENQVASPASLPDAAPSLYSPAPLAAADQSSASLVSSASSQAPSPADEVPSQVSLSPTRQARRAGEESNKGNEGEEQGTRRAAGETVTKRRGVSKEGKGWRRNRDEVDRRMKRLRVLAASLGLCGSLAACLQNELIIRGMRPHELPIDVLKGINSLLSLLLLLLTLRLHSLQILFERIRLHLRALHVLQEEVQLGEVLGRWSLWGELVVCCVHVPPYVTWEVPLYNWNNLLTYRLETLGAAFNLLRLFLFWKCFRDAATSSLPRRHTVSSFTGVRMDSAFVLKRILNSPQAFGFIAGVWLLLLLVSSYWFRCFELSACFFGSSQYPLCESLEAKVWVLDFQGEHNTTVNVDAFEKVNDLYIQNALWAMFTTSTTVG